MLLTKAELAAKNLLNGFGLDDISALTSTEIKHLIQGRGAFYEEVDLEGKDGRIVSYSGKSIISINRTIIDPGKKRFTAAHELGHFELHKDLAVNADTYYDLCNWYQLGNHEKEANEFAAELLMPATFYRNVCKGQLFSSELVFELGRTFIVSRTAAILKFVKCGNHPICVVCVSDNRVRWWKMTKEMEEADHDFVPNWLKYRLKISKNLPPPVDSVVGQLFRRSSRPSEQDKFQEIEKSTWFLTHPKDDPKMYEYCHFIPSYNFALSVIWED